MNNILTNAKPTTIIPPAVQTEISEVFSSLQGEGPYLGQKQIFVRFGRCNMHCVYCDELDKMQRGAFETVDVEDVSLKIQGLEKSQGAHHSVSLTGGEPLMYPQALEILLPKIHAIGLKTYLETNGTFPDTLKRFVNDIDIVAMDLKPPSSTQDRAYWKEHAAFLKIAATKEVFTKLVITSHVTCDDVEQCVETVRSVNPAIPFVFQPESEITGINLKALKLIQEKFIHLATKHLTDVRVIPQMHKIWGVR